VHILLVHGALGDATQLAPLRAHLADAHDVHLLELEGHGHTPLGGDAYDMDSFVTNVRDFLSGNGIGRAGIFGYSMGGYVALSLASRHPDLVDRVATLGTKFAWSPEIAARETSRLDPATIRAKVPKFAALLEERHAGAGGWETVLQRTARLMTGLGTNPTIDAATLAKISVRARLMVGDRDAVVTTEETIATARALAAGETTVLPGTPHPFEQVRGPLLGALLRDFFA
jgi:pimeloyl-ACP methyl ester carboxylesterase